MDNIIYDILSEWCSTELERTRARQAHPGYTQAVCDEHQASDTLLNALDATGRAAFLDYEQASGTTASLCEDAAFLAGIRAGMRLIISL